jgi:hypothetical protein
MVSCKCQVKVEMSITGNVESVDGCLNRMYLAAMTANLHFKLKINHNVIAVAVPCTRTRNYNCTVELPCVDDDYLNPSMNLALIDDSRIIPVHVK